MSCNKEKQFNVKKKRIWKILHFPQLWRSLYVDHVKGSLFGFFWDLPDNLHNLQANMSNNSGVYIITHSLCRNTAVTNGF